MKTQRIPIAKIKENPNNPRFITDEKFEQLVISLLEFPEMLQARPLVVTPDFVTLGGNQRLKALRFLHALFAKKGELNKMQQRVKKIADDLKADRKTYGTAPVYVATWDEAHNDEFLIKDNVSFGQWDTEALSVSFGDFAPTVSDWGLDVNFDTKPEVEKSKNAVPVSVPTSIKLGDLITVGDHRLLCGSSLTDLDNLMQGNQSDMVFTDPPYGVDYGSIHLPKFKQRKIANDSMTIKGFRAFCEKYISEIKRLNKGCVYMCGPSLPPGRIMFTAADKLMHCSTVIIWNKDTFTLGRGKYQNKYEPIWFGWPEKGTFYADRKQTNVWDIDRPKVSREHPTMKPVALVQRALEHASQRHDIVLDLFGGSGTTMVAAQSMRRTAYLCELEPEYCLVAVRRMHDLYPELPITLNGETVNLSDLIS